MNARGTGSAGTWRSAAPLDAVSGTPRPWPSFALLALVLVFAAQPSFAQRPAAAAAGATTRIDFGKDAIQPTPAQTAAIRRAAADDIKEFIHPGQRGYVVAQADLNDDGRLDLLVRYDDISFCGSSGCSGVIVMATPTGYAGKPIGLPNFGGEIDILPTTHHGMHDLQYNGNSPVWKWNGKDYAIDKADLPGGGAPAWETRQAAGHPMMAVATPIDSTIGNLFVFCEQGTPLLAMVTKMRPPAGPVTLTFVFRGWTVNVPMRPDGSDARLWVANLSGSDLPLWLAHRGSTPTTNQLARLAELSYLRINGGMQGQISLDNSTAATRSALAGCYRY